MSPGSAIFRSSGRPDVYFCMTRSVSEWLSRMSASGERSRIHRLPLQGPRRIAPARPRIGQSVAVGPRQVHGLRGPTALRSRQPAKVSRFSRRHPNQKYCARRARESHPQGQVLDFSCEFTASVEFLRLVRIVEYQLANTPAVDRDLDGSRQGSLGLRVKSVLS